MMKDDKTVPERIAEIRRMMEMASELEAVRKKHGRELTGADTTPAELLLGALEKEVYGSFANAVEARLRHLDQHSKRESEQ